MSLKCLYGSARAPLGGGFAIYGVSLLVPKSPAVRPSISDKTETVSGRTWPRWHTPRTGMGGTHCLSTEQKQKGFWIKAVKYIAMGMNSDRSEGEISSILALFDHLVRPRQHVRRNRQADLLGSLQIEH